ncbi:MAG TPA: hypothetical protein VGM88_33710 [Kofleriaceae bacterium]
MVVIGGAANVAHATPKQVAIGVTAATAAADPTLSTAPAIDTVATADAPSGLELDVTCATYDCTHLQLVVLKDNASGAALSVSPAIVTAATPTTATFTIQQQSSAAFVKLVYASVAPGHAQFALTHVTLPGSTPAVAGPPPTTTGTSDVRKLALTTCPAPSRDVATNEVLVTPLGSLLTPLPAHFADTDTLTVTVVGAQSLLDVMQVKRKSGIRAANALSILGDGTQIPILTQAARADQPATPTCGARSFAVSDFASGTGEVEIDANITGTDAGAIGSFQLIVDATYAGMFSIGAAWTPMLSPGFDVAMRGGRQIITQTEQGNRRLAYSFAFTPFVWDGLARDVQRPMDLKHIYTHVNPTVGFLLNDPLNNVFIGGTFDFQSAVLFTWGMMYSHVTQLDGVHVGDAFDGSKADIPTHKAWHHDWFVGISVDVRIGVKLLKTVLGSATGS